MVSLPPSLSLCFSPLSLLSAGKDKKSGGSLPRVDQDTCLFPVDMKAVEYYFASDARSASALTASKASNQYTAARNFGPFCRL